MDNPEQFDGIHCVVCGSTIAPERLQRYQYSVTCCNRCSNEYHRLKNSTFKALYTEMANRRKSNPTTQTRELTFQKKITNSNKHTCHGWIDDNGKKHACPHKTTNYRCDKCWAKMRSSVVNDTDE